ncbi:MAG: flagellar basal body L-ring protein FlgH [Epibacterium sp.]|nr:flagellar basal body L-ring protein FlgH [Epibacterium sp.]NQX74601.1 flagellar basal body L-ring protein FlgH [Epibacterium sp.]
MKLISAAKLACVGLMALGGCARLDHVGKAPTFTPANETPEHVAMLYQGLPLTTQNQRTVDGSSLWSGSRQSLLGDRRANKQGDILTVVIEIDEEASISNDTSRSRSSAESLEVPQLFGLPQKLDQKLPTGASSASAVDLGGRSSSSGSGSVSRSEQLELRVAATVVDVLPNGVLAISGSQELRVNFELRELLVTGYVRPDDISRQNEITYDKIASARVSYGGRGQITDVQQPRYGQQILDVILPF